MKLRKILEIEEDHWILIDEDEWLDPDLYDYMDEAGNIYSTQEEIEQLGELRALITKCRGNKMKIGGKCVSRTSPEARRIIKKRKRYLRTHKAQIARKRKRWEKKASTKRRKERLKKAGGARIKYIS